MLNLIRMNLFRMVHTKGVIVVFVLLMGFSVINACASAVESREAMEWYEKEKEKDAQKEMGTGDAVPDMEENVGAGSEAETDGISIDEDIEGIAEDIEGDNVVYDIGYEMGQKGAGMGIYLETPLYPDGRIQDYLMLYGAELSSGMMLLFLLIAAIIFFWGDERNGFVKNIAGQTKHKVNIFLSKLIAIGIFTLVSMLCYMLVEFAAFKCSWLAGVNIAFGMEHLKEACKVFATEYLLYMAYISGLLLLTEVTRSTAVGITIGLLGVLGFGIVFSALVQKVLHTNFQIVKYYVNTSVTEINMYVEWEVFRLALCVGGGFLVLYNVLHMFWFVKRDVV